MKFTFAHNNLNVLNLEKSLAFYKEALGLVEVRRKEKQDFTLVFLGDETTLHKLELTWLKDRTTPYNLGDNEIHLACTSSATQMGIGLRFCRCADRQNHRPRSSKRASSWASL